MCQVSRTKTDGAYDRWSAVQVGTSYKQEETSVRKDQSHFPHDIGLSNCCNCVCLVLRYYLCVQCLHYCCRSIFYHLKIDHSCSVSFYSYVPACIYRTVSQGFLTHQNKLQLFNISCVLLQQQGCSIKPDIHRPTSNSRSNVNSKRRHQALPWVPPSRWWSHQPKTWTGWISYDWWTIDNVEPRQCRLGVEDLRK